MKISAEAKKKMLQEIERHPRDTGSSEVQVALLTERISRLTEHMKANKKDFHSQRGLILLVSQRQRHLKYLKRTVPEAHKRLVGKLGLRG